MKFFYGIRPIDMSKEENTFEKVKETLQRQFVRRAEEQDLNSTK